MKKPKIVILQAAVGSYRKAFYQALNSLLKNDYALFTGRRYFEPSLVTKIDTNVPVVWVRNFYLLKRKFLIQIFDWCVALSADALVVEGNPRTLSTWGILAFRKIGGKKNVLWMHAWPRAGREASSDRLRHLMRKLADAIFVYTENQRRELKDLMPMMPVHVAANSLYFKSQIVALPEDKTNIDFIYVGRFTEAKKVFFLVKAFISAVTSGAIRSDTKLWLVGSGPDEDRVRTAVDCSELSDLIVFVGYVDDRDLLKAYYEKCCSSVSPGYIGLSITQSFSFGKPIIISRDEQHSPEVEAAKEGTNCLYFDTDSISSLVEAFAMLQQSPSRLGSAEEIALDCRNSYTVEKMTAPFVGLRNAMLENEQKKIT